MLLTLRTVCQRMNVSGGRARIRDAHHSRRRTEHWRMTMRIPQYTPRMQALALLVLLSLAACSAPLTTTTAPAAGPTVAQPPAVSPEQVEFNGVSFAYDPALAQHVKPRHVPRGEHMGTLLPEYVAFDFDPAHTHPFPGRATGIRVFRVKDLQRVNWMYKAAVAAREPMPLINGTRVLRVQDKLLSFLNGKGERAIVHYAQDLGPFTNEGLFYSYQGITDNGLYYVSATFPVKAAFLPERFADGFAGMPTAGPGDPGWMDAYVEAVHRFNRDATERLEQMRAADYQPNLQTLDALIRSLGAGEAPEWSTNPEE